MGYPDGIRIHVTEKQRELLTFLVNRRIGDIEHTRSRIQVHDARTQRLRDECDADLLTLRVLKLEVDHAGT